MNHNLHLIATIHLLIATTTCSAMENKPKILFELATAPDEKFAALVSNDRAIINGENSCRVMDITTNEPVFTIKNTLANNCISLHQKQKYFALSNKEKITIYDTKTGREKCTTQNMGSCAPLCTFNPSDSTIFIWPRYQNLSQYNYNINISSSTGICSLSGWTDMDVHPTKQQICAQANHKISLYDYDQQKNVYTLTKDLTDFIASRSVC